MDAMCPIDAIAFDERLLEARREICLAHEQQRAARGRDCVAGCEPALTRL
jgi:hypothetical protein